MDKMKIFNKLLELFISKNKLLPKEVADVWVTKLCEKFSEKNIIHGIEKMIWSPDDFPTLGKIGEFIKKYRAIDETLKEVEELENKTKGLIE